MLINPTDVIEMLILGYCIAVAMQLVLGAIYTRLGRNLLIDNEDRWTPTYFGLTGVSWMISMATATFLTLPLVDFAGKRQGAEISLMLVVLLVWLVVRNRAQNTQQQSILIVLLFSVCIFVGSMAGMVMRVRHPGLLSLGGS
jgi:peptidoglycan biosynthesis protein MviN/MurJ (putative lipid II flippase)